MNRVLLKVKLKCKTDLWFWFAVTRSDLVTLVTLSLIEPLALLSKKVCVQYVYCFAFIELDTALFIWGSWLCVSYRVLITQGSQRSTTWNLKLHQLPSGCRSTKQCARPDWHLIVSFRQRWSNPPLKSVGYWPQDVPLTLEDRPALRWRLEGPRSTGLPPEERWGEHHRQEHVLEAVDLS